MSFGTYTCIGKREKQEDTYITSQVLLDGKFYDVYGVFDGHCGQTVSKYLESNMVPRIQSALESCDGDPVMAMSRAFKEIDNEVESQLCARLVRAKALLSTAFTHFGVDGGADYCARVIRGPLPQRQTSQMDQGRRKSP